MRKNKTPGGKIVATVSIAAVWPHESYPEYDGAKAAVCPSRCKVRSLELSDEQVFNFIKATSRVLKTVSNKNVRSWSRADKIAEREHYHQRRASGNRAHVSHGGVSRQRRS